MTARAFVLESVPGLTQLSDLQDAVCSRDQLRALGVGSDDIAHQVAARRWASLGPIVVVLHRGPLSDRARRIGALLHCGADATLAAWTALDVLGLRGWERAATHVVVARGLAPPPVPLQLRPLKLHESRRHHEDDVTTRGGIRVHRAERAAIDSGAWSDTSRASCGLLAAVVQQRLTTTDLLLALLDTVGAVKRRRLMHHVLQDIAGGSQALSEIDFLRFCRKRGLPEPVRQVVRVDSQGRRRYLDIEWRLPGGRRVWVEIDGIGHMDAARWYDDLLRTAEIQAVGDDEAPLRLPATACRAEPDRIEALLRAHLGLVSLSTPYVSSRG